jgi:hypothetical protein
MHAKDDTVCFDWSTSAGCRDMQHLIAFLDVEPLLAVYDRPGFLLNFPFFIRRASRSVINVGYFIFSYA